MAWLGVSLVLSLLSASIIGLYEDTLAAAIALAAFLPVISGMGGNSGNQALAVSIRELALGLIQPDEFWWVLRKEAGIGLINGLLLGMVLAVAAVVWKNDPRLGVVVGAAMALSTFAAACLGGIIPLVLTRLKLDPALATGPLLMALTDLCGFFLALSLASLLLRPLTS
jgi:magnesium transporter